VIWGELVFCDDSDDAASHAVDSNPVSDLHPSQNRHSSASPAQLAANY
jgi:hypothetical protein